MDFEVAEKTSEEIRGKIGVLDYQISAAQETLQADQLRREEFKIENERRKHNYIPFILELLNLASERGDLAQQYEKAKSAMNQPQPGSKPA